MDTKELRDQRGKTIAQARVILEKAESEGRALTAEEQTNYDKAMTDQAELKDRITQAESLANLEREVAQTVIAKQIAGDAKKPESKDAEKLMGAFRHLLVNGKPGGDGAALFAALQTDVDTAGGYTVPKEFATGLLKALDNLVFIRQKATVISGVKGSLGVPTLEADPADADWTAEIGTVTEDSTMSFGNRELNPHALSKLIKVSRKLVRSAATAIDSIVRDRLAYKFAVSEEKGFISGNGAKQPLGLFTASANGISISRDTSSGSTTSITADALRDAKYALTAAYRRAAEWLFHRDGIKIVSKLKDSNNQYLWQVGLAAGDPDRLLNHPINESEYVPNTFTTGLYVGMFGDFSYYHIADSLNMEVQVLNELYAANNQHGYIGRKETDGMPVLEAAFARLKTN